MQQRFIFVLVSVLAAACFVAATVAAPAGAAAYDCDRHETQLSERPDGIARPALQPSRVMPRAFLDGCGDVTNLARASARSDGYRLAPRALPRSSLPSPADAADLVRGARPVGSALRGDAFHRSATWAVDDIASSGSVYRHVGGDGVQRTLIQTPGELNGIAGRFEWIVDDFGNLTHQLFVKGGSINGVPTRP